MPEEENEYLEEADNSEESNNISSSNLSLKNNARNIVDFNKYKSRKNNSSNINNSKKSNNSNVNNSGNANNANKPNLPIRNKLSNGGKPQIANKASSALSNVAKTTPGLGAIGALNNIRKNIAARKNSGSLGGVVNNNNSNSKGDSSSDDVKDNNVSSVRNNSENTNEGSEKKPFNPLSSIFGSKPSIAGKLSFLGKMSLPLKLAAILGPVLTLLFFILIPVSVITLFSSFFGMNEVNAYGSSTGNIDYGDYELSSDGDEILHEPLDSFLESKGTSLEEFNNLIASNVENAGYGTRAGVVAAAVTLIAELGNNYDVKIPYFWGGGHAIIAIGAEGNWGSSECHISANGQSYNYCGLDCSGFVPWAIKNGGFNITPLVTGGFQSLPGARRVTLSSSSAVLEPGDLLESSSHIVLVVGVDEDTDEYICAEASGNSTGVLFTRRPFSRSGYWGVDMSGFYATRVRS